MPDHVSRVQAEWQRERPDLDVTPIGVIGRLHRLAAALTAELVAVHERHGLSEGEFDVLAALRRAGPPYARTAGELAAYTMVTTGGLTKRVDRLEAAGLVTRRRSADDGRGRVIALTRAGKRVIDAAFADHLRNERRLLAQLSERDAAQLERILTRWLAVHEPGGTATASPDGRRAMTGIARVSR